MLSVGQVGKSAKKKKKKKKRKWERKIKKKKKEVRREGGGGGDSRKMGRDNEGRPDHGELSLSSEARQRRDVIESDIGSDSVGKEARREKSM